MHSACDPTASVTQGRVLNAEQKGVLLSSLLCLEDGAAVLGPGGSWPSLCSESPTKLSQSSDMQIHPGFPGWSCRIASFLVIHLFLLTTSVYSEAWQLFHTVARESVSQRAPTNHTLGIVGRMAYFCQSRVQKLQGRSL